MISYPGLTAKQKYDIYVIKPENGQETSCWGWSGSINSSGYSLIGYDGVGRKRCKYITGHRFSYQENTGPLISGHHIHHKCGNTLCTNPNHLEQLTPKEHAVAEFSGPRLMRDKTHCKNGHPLLFDESKQQRLCDICYKQRRRDREAYFAATGTQERTRFKELPEACGKGHKFTEENTLYAKSKMYGVNRRCRQCHTEREVARYKKLHPEGRILATHCHLGHPLQGENIYLGGKTKKTRICKSCEQIHGFHTYKKRLGLAPEWEEFLANWQAYGLKQDPKICRFSTV
jgi:hypothetical protein